MHLCMTRRLLLLTLSVLLCIPVDGAESERGTTNRSNAIKALCARLEIGPGAMVADAGFPLQHKLVAPAKERFFMVFATDPAAVK
jgi:hypothetical protein